jgi:toxin HigB-1
VEARTLVSYLDIRYKWASTGTSDVYEGHDTKAARAACPVLLWPSARRKLDRVVSADRLDDLRHPPGSRLEALSGDRKGQYSIRINRRFRICFRWTPAGADEIEIADYH